MSSDTINKLASHEYSNVRVLVDIEDYNIDKDTRLLIPFSYYQHYGLMNQAGEIVVEPKFDRILDSCRTEYDVVRVGVYHTYGFNGSYGKPSTYLRTKWGLVNHLGNFILKPEYKSIGVSDDKRILTLRHLDGQYEVINLNGESIVPKGKFQWVDSFNNGFARVNYFDGKNRNWGLIDASGKVILPLMYSMISNFHKSRTWITVEAIDNYENKSVGKFYFSTGKLTI